MNLSYSKLLEKILENVDEKYHKRIKKVDEILLLTYGRLRKTYLIHAVKKIKEDNKFVTLELTLSYDAPPGSFVPQDCPSETLIVNLDDGIILTLREMREGKHYWDMYLKGAKKNE